MTSKRLTFTDTLEIWRLHSLGLAQHQIAALFGTNQGRISEVLSGKRFATAKRLAENQARDCSEINDHGA